MAADLLARLRAPDAGECPICMDAPQAPAMTACAHGPFCHECILAALQHQARPHPVQVSLRRGLLFLLPVRYPCDVAEPSHSRTPGRHIIATFCHCSSGIKAAARRGLRPLLVRSLLHPP